MNEDRRILGYEFRTTCFLDLMKLNINIYTSLDQDSPEFQINHPQNTNEINIFLKTGDIMMARNYLMNKIKFR